MAEERIIMYDSPEAAEKVTFTLRNGRTYSVWVSHRNGNGPLHISLDEHSARYNGATHHKCYETGEVIPIYRRLSDTAQAQEDRRKWERMTQVDDPVHGFFIGEDYYSDIQCVVDEIGFRFESIERDGLTPIWAKPVYLPEVCLSDIFCDYYTDDQYDLDPWPKEADTLVAKLNEVCRGEIAYYVPSKERPSDAMIEAWWAEIQEALEGSNG